jgi:hypothetical protein
VDLEGGIPPDQASQANARRNGRTSQPHGHTNAELQATNCQPSCRRSCAGAGGLSRSSGVTRFGVEGVQTGYVGIPRLRENPPSPLCESPDLQFAARMSGAILTPADRAHLLRMMRQQRPSPVHRRMDTMLFLDDGWSAERVAEVLFIDADTVREHRRLHQTDRHDRRRAIEVRRRRAGTDAGADYCPGRGTGCAPLHEPRKRCAPSWSGPSR